MNKLSKLGETPRGSARFQPKSARTAVGIVLADSKKSRKGSDVNLVETFNQQTRGKGRPSIRPATAHDSSTRAGERPPGFSLQRQAFEEERHASTARWGALTLDSTWSRARVWTSSNAPYRTFRESIEHARAALETAGAGARYYSFHSGLGGDLVFELHEAAVVATHVTLAGRRRVEALDDDQARVLAEDAALREVAGTVEERGLEAAYGVIERAVATAGGRAELLPVAVDLIRAGKYALAVSIVDQRLHVAPNDVNAMMLDARITIILVKEGKLGLDHLENADARFRRVIELEPNNLRGLLMWSEVPRLAGNSGGCVPRYAAVLKRFPGCEMAHYNLASVLLARDPETALAHFTAGERLSPEDADYAIGCARSCLALGRMEGARLALTRARSLSPAHPALAALETYAAFGFDRRIA